MSYRWRWAVMLAVATAVACAGCTAEEDTHHAGSTNQASPSTAESSLAPDRARKTRASEGCGGTAIHRGGAPSWASGEEHGFRGENDLPYAMSDGGRVVAYLYGDPLAVNGLGSHRDKILWFVKPQTGPLQVTAHPVAADGPTFSKSVSAAGSAGFPSFVRVPDPGCWRFTLTWTHGASEYRDTLSLRYLAHR